MSYPHSSQGDGGTQASSPPATVVEKARLRDLRAVAEIQRRSFRPGLAYGYPALLTLWFLPFVTFLVSRRKETGQVVGCIIGDRNRDTVRIMNIAVHPDARREGLGRGLLDAIAEQLPGGDVVLMVEEMNRGAQALYESHGFIQTGFQRNYYGPSRHGIEMTLRRGPQPPLRNGKPTSSHIRV